MSKPRLLVEALYSYGGDREDRLTEVLASVLEVHDGLVRRLVARLGLKSNPASFSAETQFGPAGQRRLVDLVLRGYDAEDRVVATIFLESKYNPAAVLEAYWFDEDQARRQREALGQHEGESVLSAVASKSDLDRLDGPLDARPSFDPRDAYDSVISWTDVKVIALELAEAEAPAPGRSGATPTSDRMLLEFLAYLELEGDAMGALGNDDLFALARILLTQDRVDRLLSLATKKFAGAVDLTVDSEEMLFEPDEDNSAENGFYYTSEAPDGGWLRDLKGAVLVSVDLLDADDTANASPSVFAGIAWNAGREGKKRLSGSGWERRARERSSLEIDWDKNAVSVGATRLLREIVGSGTTIAQQAAVLTGWAQTTIEKALTLPAPPNVDEEEDDGIA